MVGLPPSARLRRAADFAALRVNAGRMQTQHFQLRWIRSLQPGARMGLAVSRKVSKRAVVRNRIKRITREAFRRRRVGLPALDILVIARPTAATLDRQRLRADIDGALARLQALKVAPATGTIDG